MILSALAALAAVAIFGTGVTIMGVSLVALGGAVVGGIVGNKIMGRATTLGSVLTDAAAYAVGAGVGKSGRLISVLGKHGAAAAGAAAGSITGSVVGGTPITAKGLALAAAGGYAISAGTEYYMMERGNTILTAADMHGNASDATLDDLMMMTSDSGGVMNLTDANRILEIGTANPDMTIGEAAIEAGLLYDVTEVVNKDLQGLVDEGLDLAEASDQMRRASGVSQQMINKTKVGVDYLNESGYKPSEFSAAIAELQNQGIRTTDTIDFDIETAIANAPYDPSFDVSSLGSIDAGPFDSGYDPFTDVSSLGPIDTGPFDSGMGFESGDPGTIIQSDDSIFPWDTSGGFVSDTIAAAGWGWGAIKDSLKTVGGLGTVASIGASLYQKGIAADVAEQMAQAQVDAAQAAIAAQERGATLSIEEQRRQYDLTRADMLDQRDRADPFYEGGLAAFEKLGGILTGDLDPTEELRATPGYKFRTEEAARGTEKKLAQMGMSKSGRAMLELERQRMGLADEAYESYIGNLFKASGFGPQALGLGQNALNTIATQGQATTSGIQDALARQSAGTAAQLANVGQARSSAYETQGGAKTSAVEAIMKQLGKSQVFS